MPNRKQTLVDRLAANRVGWIHFSLGVALAICSGCAAQLSMDPSPPLANFSAKAKRVFQRSDRPADSNTQPSAEQEPPVRPEPTQTVQPTPNAPANPQTPTVSQSVSQVTFQDEQPLPDQRRSDAMQATYQAPLGRTYSNPPPPSYQDYPPQYPPAHQQNVPQNMNFQQRQFDRGYPPRAQMYQPPMQQQPYSTQPFINHAPPQPFINQAPPQVPNQPSLHGPNETQIMATHPAGGNTGPASGMDNTGGSGTGHLAGGMNLVGTKLRQPAQTATEYALQLRNQNERLREELKVANLKAEQLTEANKTQQETLNDSKELVTKSNRLAALLREKIASLNVKIQDLEKDKILIEQNADNALKEIETQLDSMLLNSLSKTNK